MKDVLGITAISWLILNLMATFLGAAWIYPEKPCKGPLIRIEYILPGHRLGCWLKEVP
jgi:hypothetical protein